MLWTLPIWMLLLGIQVSTADMVTTVTPSVAQAPLTPVTETPAIPTTSEKPKVQSTIRALHITSDIKYRYAKTLISSRVVNPSDQSGEASFSVTLPESAFISEFLMEVKGKVYKAYVKEKEEAKAVYEQAVQAGQFAGHVALSARDSNQFTVSLNVEAHGKVTFNLTCEELLNRRLGVYTNTININPQQIVKDMSVKVNIEEATPITTLEVPEFQISNEAVPDKTKQNELAKIDEISPNHKQVVWAPTPEQQKSQNSTGFSGQFVVKYDVDRKDNPQQILVDEGYFVHFFAPENLPKLKKHAVFVLDYSGSMAGRKLDQLKDAMNKILSDLDSKDFFSIVIFHSYILAWSPKKTYSTSTEYMSRWEKERYEEAAINTTLDREFVVEVSPANIDLARTYLGNYSDLGATNIMGGLRTGLDLVNIGSKMWENESDPPQPVVIFLTDGQPNVEDYDTEVIINKTKHLNIKECPVFSLAFGSGADYKFLRKLSLSNNGFARNIYEAADASDQLTNFYKTVSSPLLSNVTFTYLPGQVDNSSSTKTGFPVYFNGSELVVAGKINKDMVKDNGTIGELSGFTANGFHKFPIIIDIIRKPQNRSLGHLEKTWAYLTIQQLLDKADSLDNSAEKNQTKQKALELALQYSFVTPLTSLVVVKPNETESAVDTTQLKPGTDFAQFSSSAMFGAPGVGYGGAAFGVPQLALSAGTGSRLPSPPSKHYMPQVLNRRTMYHGHKSPKHGYKNVVNSQEHLVNAVVFQSTFANSFPTTAMDSTTVKFEASQMQDYPPVANAGQDMIIYLPQHQVTLNGSLSSDDKAIIYWEWTISPSYHGKAVDMQNTRTPLLKLSNLEEGVYKFILKVTDEANQFDTATVNVYVKSPTNKVPTDSTDKSAQKVPLHDITWLQQFLTNSSTSGNITVSVQGHQYNLALNETDQSFGVCQVNNKSGECHHIQYCALNIFKDDVSEFIPYQCTITGDYLGVCCPENVS